MINYLILAASEEVADVYTLGNSLFTLILKALIYIALIVVAVILGGKLRKRSDAKNAAQVSLVAAEVSEETVEGSNSSTEE